MFSLCCVTGFFEPAFHICLAVQFQLVLPQCTPGQMASSKNSNLLINQFSAKFIPPVKYSAEQRSSADTVYRLSCYLPVSSV